MEIEVVENPVVRVEIDRDRGLVRFVRSTVPVDAEGLSRAVDEFQLIVPLRERPRLALLQDMRAAPPIRDQGLEAALNREVPRLFAKFLARAILLGTAFGKLQASRFVKLGDSDARVFGDEHEAERYLDHEIAAKRRGDAKGPRSKA